MKKYMFFVLVGIFLAVGSAHAQSQPIGMTVDIPFDFVAGDVTLHEGKYTVQPVGINGDSLLLRSADLKEAVLLSPCVWASDAKPPSRNKLMFKVEGSRHYLWQIWIPGDDRGRELKVRLQEKKLTTPTKGSPAVTVASIRQ
jgi:hypothetical protein